MNIQYVLSNTNTFYSKYNFFDLNESEKSISQIQKEILSIPDFCRSQQSISTSELKSYIVSGISFFTLNNGIITGLVNFDVNKDTINIMGLCVPGISSGIGSFLIGKVKEFASKNNILYIKLTCYGSVKLFYEKLGFTVVDEQNYYNSDDEDEDEDNENPQGKIRYDMIFDMANFTGGKRKKKSKSKNKSKNKRRKTFKKRT